MSIKTRRDLLKMMAAGILIPVIGSSKASDEATPLPYVSEDDPTAIGLQYRTTQEEAAKITGYVEGHRCDNCMHYVSPTKGCNLFPGKAVVAEGWCRAWVAPQ